MKKNSYWLSILPQDIKEKWLNNFSKEPKYLEVELEFISFISRSFNWSDTPEGYHYWEDISITVPSEFIIQKREETINTILNEEK